MEIVKVIDSSKTFVGRDGNLRKSVNYFLVVDVNGVPHSIAIRPSFPNGRAVLDLVAKIERK